MTVFLNSSTVRVCEGTIVAQLPTPLVIHWEDSNDVIKNLLLLVDYSDTVEKPQIARDNNEALCCSTFVTNFNLQSSGVLLEIEKRVICHSDSPPKRRRLCFKFEGRSWLSCPNQTKTTNLCNGSLLRKKRPSMRPQRPRELTVLWSWSRSLVTKTWTGLQQYMKLPKPSRIRRTDLLSSTIWIFGSRNMLCQSKSGSNLIFNHFEGGVERKRW